MHGGIIQRYRHIAAYAPDFPRLDIPVRIRDPGIIQKRLPQRSLIPGNAGRAGKNHVAVHTRLRQVQRGIFQRQLRVRANVPLSGRLGLRSGKSHGRVFPRHQGPLVQRHAFQAGSVFHRHRIAHAPVRQIQRRNSLSGVQYKTDEAGNIVQQHPFPDAHGASARHCHAPRNIAFRSQGI